MLTIVIFLVVGLVVTLYSLYSLQNYPSVKFMSQAEPEPVGKEAWEM